MARRKRKGIRIFNALDSRLDSALYELDGYAFVMQPLQDAIAWKTLQYYAVITPNVPQRDAILAWLEEHPCPAMPAVEQVELC